MSSVVGCRELTDQLVEFEGGSRRDSGVGSLTPGMGLSRSSSVEVEELDLDEPYDDALKETAIKTLEVVWFPEEEHSEIGIGDRMIYYIGKNPRYGMRSIEEAIRRSEKTPVVIASVPITETNIKRMLKDLEGQPVSKINSCMGSVAEIINRYAEVKIPPVVRQFPAASGFYLMVREAISPEVVKVQFHGNDKRQMLWAGAKNLAIEFMILCVLVNCVYSMISSVVT